MCGRRWGKSLISQILSITSSLNNLSVAYVTPTFQLAKTFFDQLIKYIPVEVYTSNKQDMTIKLSTGGFIQFFTGQNLDSFRGLKFHLVIIDEASYIPDLEDGWNNAIRPTLTDYKGNAIFLSTPKGKNYFYQLFLKGVNGEANWQSFKFSTYDNPHIDRGEVDDAKASLPAAVFEQEYMANPMENAANPFGSTHIRQCIYPLSTNPVYCYGIDLAKSVDWTVIIGLDKTGNTVYVDRFQKDWKQTKETILMLPNIRQTPVLIDSTGVGDPVVEELQRECEQMVGFKFSSTSKQKLMEGLCTSIQKRKITYPEGVIVNELEIFEYKFTNTGVKYSAPDGYNDDAVMALALANKCLTDNEGAGMYSIV